MRLQNKRTLSTPGLRSNLHWQEMDTLGIAHLWEQMDQGDTRGASTGQTKLQRQIGKTCSWRISEEAAKPRGFFWAKFLIKPWQLTAAGCLKEKQDLKLIWRRVQHFQSGKACKHCWGYILFLHKSVWICNGRVTHPILDALLKHWVPQCCKQDTGAS